MTKAGTMKNDKLDSDLSESFNQINMAAHDLRTVSWLMNCMADPSESPPKGIHHRDLGYFFAKLLMSQAETIDQIAGAAHQQLRERQQASR